MEIGYSVFRPDTMLEDQKSTSSCCAVGGTFFRFVSVIKLQCVTVNEGISNSLKGTLYLKVENQIMVVLPNDFYKKFSNGLL